MTTLGSTGTPGRTAADPAIPRGPAPGGGPQSWWRDAVLYQVYLRSYADGDGDGVGDIRGLRRRLGHIADLGADAVLISPWYRSPMVDGGYDVTDHCDVDPLFGTLADAEGLVDAAHAKGLRILVELVANHTSVEHPWFRSAVAAGAGSPERRRYFFRDGRGPRGDDPPNDWISAFGGPAWSRITEPDGSPGQWYLHLFAPEQPDVDWDSPWVREGFEQVIRFWLDRGVDGLRVDAGSALAKEPGLPDFGFTPADPFAPDVWQGCPFWDVDGVHDVLRHLRSVTDSYPEQRLLLGEIATNGIRRFAAYLRPGELHTAFIIRFAKQQWDAEGFRTLVDEVLPALNDVGACATWMLGSHDEPRPATRLAGGERRARAATLLMLALPGAACIYQGEELGLPDVPIADAAIRDPVFRLTGGSERGRDGARVPLPWNGDRPPYGFTTGPATWLPQPADWRTSTVAAQSSDAGSVLNLYRAAISLRRTFAGTDLEWRTEPEGVLAFARGQAMLCMVNLSERTHDIPGRVLLASEPGIGAALPPGTAAWIATS